MSLLLAACGAGAGPSQTQQSSTLAETAAASPSPTQAASAALPDHGRIAFNVEFGPPGCAATNSCDAYADIYTIEPDGTDLLQLTHETDGSSGSPTWMPAGDRILYLRDGRIYSMNAAGGDVRQLTTGPGGPGSADKGIAVSPDGTLIAYGWHEGDSEHPQLVVMRSDGTDAVALTTAPQDGDGDGHPTFSPDGSQVAFWRNGALEVINVDGTGLREVLPGSCCADLRPRWSPDGTRLLFASEDGRVQVVNTDGTGLTDLGPGSYPDWSPDGARIVYARWTPGTAYIALVVAHADGSNPVEIWHTTPNTDTFVIAPDWGTAP